MHIIYEDYVLSFLLNRSFPSSPGPLIWKWFVILMRIKLTFTRKVVHLASFWKWAVLELGSGLNYWAVPVIYEKAFKIWHRVALITVFIKKASFQDRQIGNTPKFPSILGSIVVILFNNLSCLEFVYSSFIYHDFWNYKVWNLFAFYLNSNIQNFFILTKIICQTPHVFLFCFKWAMVCYDDDNFIYVSNFKLSTSAETYRGDILCY